MPSLGVREYLDRNDIRYAAVTYSAAFGAMETERPKHINVRYLVKTHLVNIEDRLVMAVAPAEKEIDLDLLAQVSGGSSARLAHEGEFDKWLMGCSPGTIPPFGNLFDIRVYADRSIILPPYLAFAVGNDSELIVLESMDYIRLEQPILLPTSPELSRVG